MDGSRVVTDTEGLLKLPFSGEQPDMYCHCHCLDGYAKNIKGVRSTLNSEDFNIRQVFLRRIAIATYLVNPSFREQFFSFLAMCRGGSVTAVSECFTNEGVNNNTKK